MGPSGAGKTTLLHTLANKIHAKTLTGQITYNGAAVTEKSVSFWKLLHFLPWLTMRRFASILE